MFLEIISKFILRAKCYKKHIVRMQQTHGQN